MSHSFKRVNWNPRKRTYDLALWVGIIAYIAIFIVATKMAFTGDNDISMPIILIRAFSSCAFLMLTVILCIGPLARIDIRFLPLLYNRRHFGVSFFIVALLHALVAIYWYHSFGDINPILSVIISGGSYASVSELPFQVFGLLALLLFFVMAATSHDYWNAVLSTVWKWIHMGVYVAYALLIVHIATGAMQQNNTGILPFMLFISVFSVAGLHLYSALFASKETHILSDSEKVSAPIPEAWVKVGRWQDIANDRAITVRLGDDERVAVFRYSETKLCAVSNVCQHQNGPLGEGKVIDGCITCPWHGYQYRPEDGCSPPPFTEKIETYQLMLQDDCIYLNRSHYLKAQNALLLKSPTKFTIHKII